MRILTGIDLPYAPSCGSIILCDELYSDPEFSHDVRFLALAPAAPTFKSALLDLHLLAVPKVTDVNAYQPYVAALTEHVRRHVDEHRPDVIHIQHLSYGMALALSSIPEIPTVAICHGTDVLSALTDPFHRGVVQRIVDRADVVVFPSRVMLTDTRRVAVVDPKKIRFASWGLPRQYFTDCPSARFERGPIRVLFAGRLLEGKGIPALLEALARMPEDVELTIAGDGSLRESLAATALRLGISDRVRLLGWLSRESLRSEYARHHVLVAPSRGIEAFCLVAVEAQACGLPVVHARVGGLPEVVDQPELSFDPANEVDGIAHAVSVATESPQRWLEFSKRSLHNAARYRLQDTASTFAMITREVGRSRAELQRYS